MRNRNQSPTAANQPSTPEQRELLKTSLKMHEVAFKQSPLPSLTSSLISMALPALFAPLLVAARKELEESFMEQIYASALPAIQDVLAFEQAVLKQCNETKKMFAESLSSPLFKFDPSEFTEWWPRVVNEIDDPEHMKTSNYIVVKKGIMHFLERLNAANPIPELAPYLSIETKADPSGKKHLTWTTSVWKKEPTDKKLGELATLYFRECDTYQKRFLLSPIPRTLQTFHHDASAFVFKEANYWFLMGLSIAPFFLKPVIDRTLLKLYKRFRKDIALTPAQITTLSADKSQQLIDTLRKENQEMLASGYRLRRLFRFTLIPLVVIGILVGVFGEEFLPIFFMLGLSVVGIAGRYIHSDFKEVNHAKNLLQQAELPILLKQLTGSYVRELGHEKIHGTDHWMLKPLSHESLSEGTVTRVIRNILITHNIDFETRSASSQHISNAIFISESAVINQDCKALNTLIGETLERRNKIKLLHKQIKKLEHFSDIEMIPQDNKESLPTVNFELQALPQYRNILSAENLRAIFGSITVQGEKIIIAQHELGNETRLKELLLALNNVKKSTQDQDNAVTATTTSSSSSTMTMKRFKKNAPSAPAKTEFKRELKQITAEPILIDGVSHVPDAPGSRLHSLSRIGRINQFILFSVKEEQFSNSIVFKQYKSLAEKVTTGSFVDKMTGNPIHDNAKQRFIATCKLRINNLDTRVWGRRRTSDNGDTTIFEMKGVEVHRPNQR